MFIQLLTQLNWLHVIVAAIAFFVLGALWYSPVLFSRPWAKLVNLNMSNPDAKKGMGMMMFASFILMIICCSALAVVFSIIQIDTAFSAIKFGLFFGVGFALTAVSISFIYERKPLALHAIDIGYLIAGIVIASLILVLWK
jgi:hypothetical protein